MLKLVFCLVAFNGGFFILAWASNFSISNENGPIEIFQVLILGLVFVTYALSISKQEGATQTLGVAFSYVCLFYSLKNWTSENCKSWNPAREPSGLKTQFPSKLENL